MLPLSHHAGVVDARTGRAVSTPSHARQASLEQTNGDMMGGYGFFDSTDVDLILAKERKERRAPVGTWSQVLVPFSDVKADFTILRNNFACL